MKTYTDARDFYGRSAPDEWIPPEVGEQIIAAMQDEMDAGTFDSSVWNEKFEGYTEAVCSKMGLDEDGCDAEGNPFDAWSIAQALSGEMGADPSLELEDSEDAEEIDSYTPEWVLQSDADYLAALEDDSLVERGLWG